jgi:hypothetical protein
MGWCCAIDVHACVPTNVAADPYQDRGGQEGEPKSPSLTLDISSFQRQIITKHKDPSHVAATHGVTTGALSITNKYGGVVGERNPDTPRNPKVSGRLLT